MKRIDWAGTPASKDGDFERLPAGPYVATVTDAIDNAQREYVEVVYDIAEGERKGYYGDDWGRDHPYAHHFFLPYRTEGGQRMTKGRLEAIQASNAGFDPFAAWDADRLDMFRGRLVGINLQEEEFESSDGEVRTRLNVCQVVPAQDVRDGKVRARDVKRLPGSQRPSGDLADYAKDVSIPFA